VNVGSIGEYIRQQREQAKISLRQLSSAAGVSNPYLSQIERGLRRPDSGVRAAVLADPELTERQKQVLLEIYESFRRELAARAADHAEAAGIESAAGPDIAEPGPPGLDGEAGPIGPHVANVVRPVSPVQK